MKKRALGATGIEASVCAFGTWAIGGCQWGGSDSDASIKAIQASLDAGVNFIDTAPVYGYGSSEELLGKAIAGRKRNEIIIATKCGLRWDVSTDVLHMESEGYRIFRTLKAASIRWELEQSLARLGTDYIDLYQTHWPDPETPTEELVDTFQSLEQEGLIRAWGFCNADTNALKVAAQHGEISSDQERYSLLDRERDMDNLPFCADNNISFLCYSPIARGLLTGEMDGKRDFPAGDLRRDNPRFSQPVLDAVQAVLAPVKSLARDRDITCEQLVLAWTLRQPGVSHVLVGTRYESQAISNASVGLLELNDDELTVIDHAANAWSGYTELV